MQHRFVKFSYVGVTVQPYMKLWPRYYLRFDAHVEQPNEKEENEEEEAGQNEAGEGGLIYWIGFHRVGLVL